mmetsp:Transcript_36354/g.44377  ORF Transcript_36354/g.44377 Transcript_36354/m.44377 type:complete len:168 (+) Transcript_36354:260-763(+)
MQKADKEAGVKIAEFDPYKLLHMPADGSFNTQGIDEAYFRLAARYHPSKVNKEKVPYVKAKRRWDNLNKAHKTLTDEKMFNNWIKFGDPMGCLTQQALEASLPTWLFEEDMKPMLYTWGFIGSICFILGFMTWFKKSVTLTSSGVEKVTKVSMKEFMVAILEENDKD